MIIVDSSVWIDHLHRADAELQGLLETGRILGHPFVAGEIALGQLRSRQAVFSLLRNLRQSAYVDLEEVLDFIERHALNGSGIGYVDAHLLASARLTSALLWTRDKRLHEAAVRLKLAYRSTAAHRAQ